MLFKFRFILDCMWINDLNPKLKSSLNKLLLEVSKEKESYLSEKKSSKIQLWIALAVINFKLDELNERFPKPKESKNLKKSLNKL